MQKSLRTSIVSIILTLAWQFPSLAQSSSQTAHSSRHVFNGVYESAYLEHIAFPIGGMGAGMFCLEGTGAISHMSIRNSPDIFNEPAMFAAIAIKEIPGSARVLEGPVPGWKKFGQRGAGLGAVGTTYGLPRFRRVEFSARFPFAEVTLLDKQLPLKVRIVGWSPFIPTDSYNSSLPVGALEYHFKNTSRIVQHCIFSYNARNFMAYEQALGPNDNSIGSNHISPIRNGFILRQDGSAKYPYMQGDFAIFTDSSETRTVVDYCWFRGGWWDPITMAWNHIEASELEPAAPVERDAPGASIFVPFTLQPGQENTIRLMMAWYVPESHLRSGIPITKATDSAVRDASAALPSKFYKPWYSSQFENIQDIATYWKQHYNELRSISNLFKKAFYSSTLPAEVLEAVSANLTILKSPTVMRQYDGRFWAWEGCNDDKGSCAGTCTHVWNYAQALCHLFPDMERSIRETEFLEDQDQFGHQNYRAALPIRPAGHEYYEAAADGQLGGIMKVYREWRISADSLWLTKLYPKVRISVDYCIETWDPRHHGALEEPHHNTYDIDFWGPDGMCTGIYLGALEAMVKMGTYLGEDVNLYQELYAKGRTYMEHALYNGQYFIQKPKWTGLCAVNPVDSPHRYMTDDYSEEAVALMQKEGPKYQYGDGCLSDGVIGAWFARVCGLPEPFDTGKIASHLVAVYTNNLKKDLTDHSNSQRPAYAIGQEGGLLLCTWPNGGRFSLPFVYSNEVWTGVEYEVASHLIFQGRVKKGLDIVSTCRERYNGLVRNPFDEYECGHWYARALASYALIEALTGVRYDAVEKTLYVNSKIGDFTSFLSTATGFASVSYIKGKVKPHIYYGQIPINRITVNK